MAVTDLFREAKCVRVLVLLLIMFWVCSINIAKAQEAATEHGRFMATHVELAPSPSPSDGDPPRPSLGGESLLNFLRMHKFDEKYSNLWGSQHQNVSADGKLTTIWIDPSSGSGFKSKKPYMYGLFNAAIKLQTGYTAGIITTFYLSNNQVYEGKHDEVDFEFLGTVPGEPYKLQTNVYGNGSGDGPKMVGREQQFHLWFDPTQAFHDYTILWTPHQIVWLVDGIVIRRFMKNKQLSATGTFPAKPMSAYATIWDGSDWATDGGRYRANYSYGPFISQYSRFVTIGCDGNDKSKAKASKYCSALPLLDCLMSPRLDKQQLQALQIVRQYYMTYDYCSDYQRYPKGSMPDCSISPTS